MSWRIITDVWREIFPFFKKQTFCLTAGTLHFPSEDNRSISYWCGRLATLKLEAQISTNTDARSSFREADGPIRKGCELSPESCSIWWENFISNIDYGTHTQLPRGVWKYVAGEDREKKWMSNTDGGPEWRDWPVSDWDLRTVWQSAVKMTMNAGHSLPAPLLVSSARRGWESQYY